jgi:biotin transport system substrate-specific component
MSSVTSVSPRTLADVIPGGLVRSIALVIGGAIFVGLTAQVSIPLPFTPVPLTLQTFSVLLVGAALGSVRGAASMALYLLAGVAGVPWFANHQSGLAFASIGYIVGFVAAAWLVGRLAERGADRRVLPAIGMMALGNLVIYAFGVAGLMVIAHMSLSKALALGVLPFLSGDAIKILLAAVLLPGTWKLINSRKGSHES